MAVERQNGDIIQFIKQKDYVMVNNNLGGGSFGVTVLLKDPFIDELFVAKKYEPEFEGIKEEFYKNFLDEIKIMYKLNHKNIVRIYNYYAYEEIYTGYILMEYIEGENIETFIHDYLEPFENVSLDEVFLQLIDAFCYMETKGIIHRDIREGNILIDNTGTVKIIDFGIGKVFTKPEESGDSLAGEINREASSTLPLEYYQGVYTHLTDMFYLAELVKRLINEAQYCDMTDFSYGEILDKMMEKNPDNRFQSFAEIRDAIDKHDFINMQITDKDKTIYQDFTNLVYQSLTVYREQPHYNNTAVFISRLSLALSNNAFESVVQNNQDIISSVVACNYRYRPSVVIPTETVRTFFDWFRASTPQSQELILSNIISKLSTIRIDIPDPDLPF